MNLTPSGIEKRIPKLTQTGSLFLCLRQTLMLIFTVLPSFLIASNNPTRGRGLVFRTMRNRRDQRAQGALMVRYWCDHGCVGHDVLCFLFSAICLFSYLKAVM